MFFFFFNDTATTEIYTLSLHDALPIYIKWGDVLLLGQRLQFLEDTFRLRPFTCQCIGAAQQRPARRSGADRKSTRLNSSHGYISYAVFCLKKKTLVNTHAAFILSPAHV